jgi:hypothetical protein
MGIKYEKVTKTLPVLVSGIFLTIYSLSAEFFLIDFFNIIIIKLFFDSVLEFVYSLKSNIREKHYPTKELLIVYGILLLFIILMFIIGNKVLLPSGNSIGFMEYLTNFLTKIEIYIIILPLLVNDYFKFKNRRLSRIEVKEVILDFFFKVSFLTTLYALIGAGIMIGDLIIKNPKQIIGVLLSLGKMIVDVIKNYYEEDLLKMKLLMYSDKGRTGKNKK